MTVSNFKHIVEAPYEETPRSPHGVVMHNVTMAAYADPKGDWAAISYPRSQYGMVTSRMQFEELMGEWYDYMVALAHARHST